MMVKVLYSLLLIGTSGGVGLAIVVSWLNFKLYQKDEDRRRKSLGVLLVSMMVQNGILTYRLIELGTTEVTILGVLYVLGLAGSTVGLSWKAGQFTQDLALLEAVHNGTSGGTKLWLENVERRLVAEEKRNTTIEDRIQSSEDRADRAEEREKP